MSRGLIQGGRFTDGHPFMWPNKALPTRAKISDWDGDGDDDEEVDDIMVIGIDFGTTYSGAAWATAADFENRRVNLITSWPGTGREEGKAPTELCYEEDDTGDDYSWGYDIPLEADPVRWFKLLLLKPEDMDQETKDSEFLIRARKMMKENGKTAIGFVADYLRRFWKHVIETITKARGDSVVEALAFHVVVTVPAIWKGYARQAMEEAVKQAGILDSRPAGTTKLSFAPEPEAAALSTLFEQGEGVKKDDLYIICDAGGGTVDLICYKINETNPISMEEAVEGKGGLCGGIFVDEEFELMCKNRLGKKWNLASKAGIKEIMREWEHSIKPQFKPQATKKSYIVSIPAEIFKTGGAKSLDDTSREPHIKNGRIHFDGSHIQKAFTGVFTEIDKLVDQQIEKATQRGFSVTFIILVGGLGGSPYLYEHLKTKHSKAGIIILQSGGMKPRTAICRGAVFKGFLDGIRATGDATSRDFLADAPIQVTSTISRASYGIRFRTTFEEDVHLEEDREYDSDEGVWRANNQMRWYLQQGENVSKAKPIRHSWQNTFRSKKDFDGNFSVALMQCEDDHPPSRTTSRVKDLCTVRCKLDMPYSALEDFTTVKGKKVKRLNYELEMVPSGATLEFAVLFNGRRQQGENSVDVSF